MERIRYYIGRLRFRLMGFKGKPSYSMLGEDVILDHFTGHKEKGTYIDIGAYHPTKISNTKLFYEKGWNGINIEPNGDVFTLFQSERPRDINLNQGVGEGESVYYGNDERAGNGFISKDGLSAMGTMKLTPLRDIFQTHNLTHVDFISIDVEGFEMEVLKSNDWDKYTADMLCIERSGYDSFLRKYGYRKVFDDGGNSYYKLIR